MSAVQPSVLLLFLVLLHFPVGHAKSWPRQWPEGQCQAPGIQSSEAGVSLARPRRHILPLFSWAIFKSLWFTQEAIIKVPLGKVDFAEKNCRPSLGKIREARPCRMAEDRAETVSCGRTSTAPQCACGGQSPGGHGSTLLSPGPPRVGQFYSGKLSCSCTEPSS